MKIVSVRVCKYCKKNAITAYPTAGKAGGNRRGRQVPEHSLVLHYTELTRPPRVVESHAAHQELDPFAQEEQEHGQEGPRMQGNIERQAGVRPVEKPREENQVRGAADREELRQALHDR